MFFDYRFFAIMRVDPRRHNAILYGLSASELNLLQADLRPVDLKEGAVLFEPGRPADFIYFPANAVISFLGNTGEGASVEVWSVGNEGVAGLAGLLSRTKPFRGVVQVPGKAFAGKISNFRRHFQRCRRFHDALLRYYDYLLVQISYIGICNTNHTIEQRFSRWLLMVSDRSGNNQLRFTQDSISDILGTRRATISVAAAKLQSLGLISYSPGIIKIESRKDLANAACPCYSFINSRKRK